MKTRKKFTSVILNVQSSLALDPFISRFFIGLLLSATFLFEIKRIDSPECCFCQKVTETIFFFFCECDFVKPLWLEINNIFHLTTGHCSEQYDHRALTNEVS